MKRLLILFLMISFSIHGFAVAESVKGKSQVVAKLDGKPITKEDLENYARMIPGDKYVKMLETEEGLRKLAEFYIQRQIILQEAKKVVNKKKGVYKAHGSKMDEDAAYIIAYLTKEVESKVEITPEEIEKYMKEKNLTKQQAVSELASEKRRKLYFSLIENLKKKHRIEYCIGTDSKGANE